jgi:DNA-binding PadR family transcriptional regulator
MRSPESNPHPPLPPKVFHILLALAEEPRNGYQLGLRVENASGGAISLSPGTLYENLHRLAGLGMIQELDEVPEEKSNGRGQRFYTLTEAGMEALKAEVRRISADLALARSVPALGG